jgi:hypothetical protein
MFDMVIENGEYQDKYNKTINTIIQEWYRTARKLENYDKEGEDFKFHRHCQIGSEVSYFSLVLSLFTMEYAEKLEKYIEIAIKLDIKILDFVERWEEFNETI